MRPKILIGISSSYCASFLKGQVRFLVDEGFDVVIVSGPGEEISMLAKQEGARLYTIDFTTLISPLRDFQHLLKVLSIIKNENPDIINAGNPKSGFLIMIAAWWLRCKNRIFTMHGLVSDSRSGLKKWVIGLTEKISCRLAHKVIIVAHSLKQHATQVGVIKPGTGIVLQSGSCNGVDIEAFSINKTVLQEAAELRRRFSIGHEDFVIGFVGRLSRDKGIDLLLEAFHRLKNDFPKLRLLIVGPLIRAHALSDISLKQLYNDEKIIYTGKILDIVPIYTLMNLFVLPSLREGLPNVLLEASAMELPVIASDIPGCRDAIVPGVTGELFEKANIDALVQQLSSLIQHPDIALKYGKRGREFVTRQFSNKKIWAGYLELYKKLLVN